MPAALGKHLAGNWEALENQGIQTGCFLECPLILDFKALSNGYFGGGAGVGAAMTPKTPSCGRRAC
jgi:hypothetical protein